MANWLKFVIALASAFLLMLAFRALAFTLYTVDGRALAPVFINGDRLIVSRWSYGLRIDGGRLWRILILKIMVSRSPEKAAMKWLYTSVRKWNGLCANT